MKPYLDRGIYWDTISDQEQIASYNGMGAEWMSDSVREILDAIFDELDDAVRIHDVDYAYSPKYHKYWHQANERMRKNMILLAEKEIPWYRWFKKRRFLKLWIPLIFKAVESQGGWIAFKQAKPPRIY